MCPFRTLLQLVRQRGHCVGNSSAFTLRVTATYALTGALAVINHDGPNDRVMRTLQLWLTRTKLVLRIALRHRWTPVSPSTNVRCTTSAETEGWNGSEWKTRHHAKVACVPPRDKANSGSRHVAICRCDMRREYSLFT